MGAPFGTACYFDYCFFLEATLYFTHLLTKSSSYPKANTTERHLPLFEAICSMWLHIHPLYFSFCSWRIFPCFFALPRFLLPTFGVRLTVTFGIAFGGILMTCPIQVYLLYLICAIMDGFDSFRCNSTFEMVFDQNSFKSLRTLLFWKTSRIRRYFI